MSMAVDQNVYNLAKAYLDDTGLPYTEGQNQEFAEWIQAAIEDWLTSNPKEEEKS